MVEEGAGAVCEMREHRLARPGNGILIMMQLRKRWVNTMRSKFSRPKMQKAHRAYTTAIQEKLICHHCIL